MTPPLIPKEDWPALDAAIEESINMRYVCLGLTAWWWGWGTEQRVYWLMTTPLWPIILPDGDRVDVE